MGKEVDPSITKIYGQVSAERQASLAQAVNEKLKSIIGGYGELGVLSEYITVMLQSARPPEQIKSELDAFLQEQSAPFTAWLIEQLSKMAEEMPADAAAESKRRRREKRAERAQAAAAAGLEAEAAEKKKKKVKREKKSSHLLVAPAATAAAPPARSRSRKRRRRSSAAAEATEVAEVAKVAASKARLTPNAETLKETYTAPKENDSRFSWRADASQANALGPPPGQHFPPPQPQHYPPSQGAQHYQYTAARPARAFAPKKWRVVRANTVVRATENLQSEEVQKLQEGEIVEQVSPSFTTEQGLVRIQIRHPSSPLFPNPIGWVTQDASAAGGPKFLEPGPEPMKGAPASSTYWRPPPAPYTAPWRPRAYPGAGIPPPRPAVGSPNGKSFQNLTWKPPAESSVAAS
eukprot:TRINITY_DN22498_c0_g1_i1.p1 TRINITY_DN22498_c0_g1~~TRINITY_DN22498_c0_g1_i1.p1  ORF type:complete len:415 (-),score=94.90 TRINITY_DN22498_c0_g1_i1:45-1262(-)